MYRRIQSNNHVIFFCCKSINETKNIVNLSLGFYGDQVFNPVIQSVCKLVYKLRVHPSI